MACAASAWKVTAAAVAVCAAWEVVAFSLSVDSSKARCTLDGTFIWKADAFATRATSRMAIFIMVL